MCHLSTAETLELLDIKYAEEGSNRRVTEGQIVFNLFKLFRDIEDGKSISECNHFVTIDQAILVEVFYNYGR